MEVSSESSNHFHEVNFSTQRSFATRLKTDLKETFFPDDPFRHFKNQSSSLGRAKKWLQYLIPILEWLPKYNLHLFQHDLLAGITITSLAIPQGISYAKLADIPPIIGLYSSFVPPLVYALFGTSKVLAVGNVAAASLLLAATIREVVSDKDDPTLFLHLIFTATFVTGVFQLACGVFRLGILVDFLSHSIVVGFLSGASVIISLQQLKGIFGLKEFTKNTDIISVLKSIFTQTKHWRWESAVFGSICIFLLVCTRLLKKKQPKLFWVNAIAPMVIVITGCMFAYLTHSDQHGILTVGHLAKGLNPITIKDLNFNLKYLPTVAKAGIITGAIGLVEGIAMARSFAMIQNDQIDGNKEMIAYGMMNIVGSVTSCFLTTGPLSKSAVNYNAGSKTPMSNVIMAIGMMLTLLLLAPLFSYTPLVSLSAIIMASMLGLIDYEEAFHLFKVDKFDFCIAMSAFFGVVFLSLDTGLMISTGLSIVRALLYVARPIVSNIKRIPNTKLYRDIEQYPCAIGVNGFMILKLGSPLYFANSSYVKERIFRWIEDEKSGTSGTSNVINHVILDLGGVTSIDMTGISMLYETRRITEKKRIKIILSNPRIEVMEKLIQSGFIEMLGKGSVFLSVDEAVEACQIYELKGVPLNITNDNDGYVDDEKLSRCSSVNAQ